jgi:ubiquinone/menaquinone biosynthesis C-methylase UbiE
MPEYVYDQTWAEERERLAGIERLWDPGTRALMERLGVGSGWRCLEVGAGGGSMVEWLAERVGRDGAVLATDVYTKFLEAIDRPNVEVREHDVLAEELPEAEFDLAYARLVAEHLGPDVIARVVPAIKPGGVLLLEDYDFASATVHPENELFERVTDAIIQMMSAAGFDPYFGRRLVAEMTKAGLAEVEAEGRVRLIRGGTEETAFYRLSLQTLRQGLVAQGLLEDAEVDAGLEQLEDGANTFLSPILVSAWGRRPA